MRTLKVPCVPVHELAVGRGRLRVWIEWQQHGGAGGHGGSTAARRAARATAAPADQPAAPADRRRRRTAGGSERAGRAAGGGHGGSRAARAARSGGTGGSAAAAGRGGTAAAPRAPAAARERVARRARAALAARTGRRRRRGGRRRRRDGRRGRRDGRRRRSDRGHRRCGRRERRRHGRNRRRRGSGRHGRGRGRSRRRARPVPGDQRPRLPRLSHPPGRRFAFGHRLLRQERHHRLPQQREPDQRSERADELHRPADQGRLQEGHRSRGFDEVPVREHALLPVREPHRRGRERDRRLPANRSRRFPHRAGGHRAVRCAAGAAEWARGRPDGAPVRAGPRPGPPTASISRRSPARRATRRNATGTPTHIDAAKAFQGGKIVTATVSGASKTVQTSNLTPDATGLMTWNVSQVAAAITTAKDKNGTAICGMRALANMTSSDAIDIGTYLLSIPAVANTITMTCQ